MTCTHAKFQVPTDPHGKKRYESAMKHVEAAKKAGKSSEEIHALFKKIMEFNPMDIESIPKDEAHAKYRSAMIHMKSNYRSLQAKISHISKKYVRDKLHALTYFFIVCKSTVSRQF